MNPSDATTLPGLPMSVADNSASLAMELFSAEVAPQQEIRELLENGIQAVTARCAREGRLLEGEVRFCMYPLSLEKYGVPKLACIDNGEGMSPVDLFTFINNIYSSGRSTGIQENYGIGAKIAALNASPAGVVYETWQNGHGYRMTISRLAEGQYGANEVYSADAVVIEGKKIIEPLPTEEMPELIRKNGGFGTMVVLLGEDQHSSNTLDAPPNYSGKKGEWLAWTINSRYFEIPKEITVNTSVARSKSPKVWTRATGLQSFLEKYKKKSGVIDFPDFVLRWYLIKHHKSYRNEKKIFDSGAKIGALCDGELYDYITSGQANNRMRHHFGIPFGFNQVALIFEPKNASPTQSRADLKIAEPDASLRTDSRSIPWEDWQELFIKNMPAAIKKHIKEKNKIPVRSGKVFSKVLDNLNSYRKQNRRQKDSSGKKIGGDPLENTKAQGEMVKSTSAEGTSSTDGSSASSAKNSVPSRGQTTLLAPGNKRAARRKMTHFTDSDLPECVWMPDYTFGFNGSFICYLQRENRIMINESYSLYREVLDKWLGQTDPIAKDAVVEVIQEEFAGQAVEAVLGIKSQEGEEGFGSEDIRELLANDKALSIVATQRIRLEEMLSRRLKNHLIREGK